MVCDSFLVGRSVRRLKSSAARKVALCLSGHEAEEAVASSDLLLCKVCLPT